MKLLLSEPESNWDIYDNGTYTISIAKEGSGSASTIFGSYSHFRNYVRYKCRQDKEFINNLTEEGIRIYEGGD